MGATKAAKADIEITTAMVTRAAKALLRSGYLPESYQQVLFQIFDHLRAPSFRLRCTWRIFSAKALSC